MFAQAQQFHDAGDLNEAIASYNLAIELDPANALVYVCRAEARLEASGDHVAAMADCTKAIELDPQLAEGYGARAAIHIAHGDLALALIDLDEATRLSPDDAMVQRALAAVVTRLDNDSRRQDQHRNANQKTTQQNGVEQGKNEDSIRNDSKTFAPPADAAEG